MLIWATAIYDIFSCSSKKNYIILYADETVVVSSANCIEIPSEYSNDEVENISTH